MKLAPCLFVIAFLPLAALAAQPTDLNQPQSPPRPTPPWVKIVDQGKFDPRLKGYFTPEGLRVEIVAENPTIVNPVGMQFGNDGTLYVLEWRPSPGDEWRETPESFTYKDGTKRNVATMKKRTKDVLKILKWNPDKKLYDQSEVILEDELPSTILLHNGWIYTASRGTVRRYRQSVPGGKYDVKQIIAQGFCGFHHHQVSGLTIGHDGWLYITSGDDDNYVEGSDGSRSTVLRTGAVFRCRLDGSQMHAYSMGWRNPYRDVAFDTSFNIFHVDNDNEDGSKFTGCRLMHVAEESDFGWRLFTGARCCRPDHVRGAVFGELPGKMPAMLKTGRGSPAGLLIYNDTQFPKQYRGLLYYPDVFRKLIRAYHVQPADSTFQVAEEFEFMRSDDPLFRPCHMVIGPDGAMYICDWRTDSGGAGRLWGDGQHGRIYRVSWAGTPDQRAIPLRGTDSWAKVVRQSDEDLIKSLSGEEFSERMTAHHELMRRGPKNRPALLALLANHQAQVHARMHALGTLQSMWNDEVRNLLITVLQEDNPDFVRLAADGLSLNCNPGDLAAHTALVQALDNPSPAAKRAVALAIGRIGAPGAEDYLIVAFQNESRGDVYLTDGLIRSLERLGPRGIQKFTELANSGVERQIDRVVDAFATLRTRPAVEALPDLLLNPHLRTAQRVELIKSFGNYLFDPPLGPDLLIRALERQANQPPEVRKAGLEMLAAFGSTRNAKLAKLILHWIEDPDPEMRLTAIRTVEQARLVEAVPQLLKRVGDETWTPQERTAIAKALRPFSDQQIVPRMQVIVGDQHLNSIEGRKLRLEALRTLAQVDVKAAQLAAESYLEKEKDDLQLEAVQVLGTQPAGARKVAELYIASKLPRELLPQVTENLRKHLAKDESLGKLLTEVMKGGLLVSLDKSQIMKIQTLVKTKGSPQRGRDLYLNGKTLQCINCHRLEGVGGNVGPDLTRVWDTHSLEKVMESMIEPSKEIKEGYQSYRLTTKKGQTYTGLKVVDTPQEIGIKESTGKEVRVPRNQVEELEVSKQSLMPDNVISQLSFDQFIDLVAFLRDRQMQESLRGLALDFWVVGPFGEDLKKPFPPEVSPDPKTSYGSLSWQARQAEPNGYLDLRAAFGKDHISAYALTYVHSAKQQKVKMLCGSDDQLRIWINGEQVHEYGESRGARPDSDQVEVTVSAGWNVVLAKVTNGVATHGLYLRFAGEGLRVSSTRE